MTSRVARAAKRPIDRAAKSSYRLVRWAMMIATAWIILTPSSFASPIQYDYSGVITSAPGSSGVAAGTPFSGSFWYDPSQGIIVMTEGIYGYSPNPYSPGSTPDSSGIALSIGGRNEFNSTGQLTVGVVYSPMYVPSDQTPSTKVTVTDGSRPTPSLTLVLANPSRMMRPSLNDSGTLSLSDFTMAQLDYLRKTPSGNLEFKGNITALTSVPEPAHATIICLAAAWLMCVQCARCRRTGSSQSPN